MNTKNDRRGWFKFRRNKIKEQKFEVKIYSKEEIFNWLFVRKDSSKNYLTKKNQEESYKILIYKFDK